MSITNNTMMLMTFMMLKMNLLAFISVVMHGNHHIHIMMTNKSGVSSNLMSMLTSKNTNLMTVCTVITMKSTIITQMGMFKNTSILRLTKNLTIRTIMAMVKHMNMKCIQILGQIIPISSQLSHITRMNV